MLPVHFVGKTGQVGEGRRAPWENQGAVPGVQ